MKTMNRGFQCIRLQEVSHANTRTHIGKHHLTKSWRKNMTHDDNKKEKKKKSIHLETPNLILIPIRNILKIYILIL
jgi:hypothetical protein